jgi:amidase
LKIELNEQSGVSMSRSKRAFFLLATMLAAAEAAHSQQADFHLEEATIDDVHLAIREGRITCKGLVQLYINRSKAYNGVSNVLVTKDGEPIPPAPGVVRAGSPLLFPTQTVAISALLPNFDQYAGPPIEFGRMESTASDPAVQQQFGMTIGIPNTGQLNALGTINIRGERSVTCKGDRDRRPSDGPLPPGSPVLRRLLIQGRV